MRQARRPVPATPAAIERAAALLCAGELVAFPTETVYGLGADATNEAAVRSVFAAKGRPAGNPLIAHVADLDAAQAEAVFDGRAERLAARFWPGPLTLVLRRRAESRLAALVSASLESVALRVPCHGAALELLRAVGRPVAAPSANPSGRLSPTTAAHVAAGLGHSVKRLPSGAGHDAQMMARLCPTGMVFVPSRDGISHNPAEFTEPDDLVAGADVLLGSMLALDAMDLSTAGAPAGSDGASTDDVGGIR